ncbi:hypothetical protein TRFO_36911 [Tritrichomonas foetus]|uniref:Tubby C-terminal domain-containing protein n=1 Tax=Tritrichomonas foetus TaxID=1144522 RepID=A0A1J4JHJ5_9EUKA|nr:hypothetical protein TRFO_36911 [Tritrichomonas foetus]|eukprot:OHS96957.1 hypothetical protein TRFO_36911 [Tritrichomonas foetus]
MVCIHLFLLIIFLKNFSSLQKKFIILSMSLFTITFDSDSSSSSEPLQQCQRPSPPTNKCSPTGGRRPFPKSLIISPNEKNKTKFAETLNFDSSSSDNSDIVSIHTKNNLKPNYVSSSNNPLPGQIITGTVINGNQNKTKMRNYQRNNQESSFCELKENQIKFHQNESENDELNESDNDIPTNSENKIHHLHHKRKRNHQENHLNYHEENENYSPVNSQIETNHTNNESNNDFTNELNNGKSLDQQQIINNQLDDDSNVNLHSSVSYETFYILRQAKSNIFGRKYFYYLVDNNNNNHCKDDKDKIYLAKNEKGNNLLFNIYENATKNEVGAILCSPEFDSFSLRSSNQYGDEIMSARIKMKKDEPAHFRVYFFSTENKIQNQKRIPEKLTNCETLGNRTNFGNRNFINSTKNFILNDDNNIEYVAIRKIEKHKLALDCQSVIPQLCCFALGIIAFTYEP